MSAVIGDVFESATGICLKDCKPSDDLYLDLGMDDEDFDVVTVELEAAFDVDLPLDWYDSLKTVGELLAKLDELVK